jgi:hypothetical protein
LHVAWCMLHGVCCMVYVACCVVYVAWCMLHVASYMHPAANAASTATVRCARPSAAEPHNLMQSRVVVEHRARPGADCGGDKPRQVVQMGQRVSPVPVGPDSGTKARRRSGSRPGRAGGGGRWGLSTQYVDLARVLRCDLIDLLLERADLRLSATLCS